MSSSPASPFAPPAAGRTALASLRTALDAHTDALTGFLPPRTPLIELPPPFEAIAAACRELAPRYHGPGLDCRPWLDALFPAPREDWAAALATADRALVDALMTKVSLLCHAYRWRGMPADPALYKITSLRLPAGLDSLWTALAARLGTPRVGLFYTMVTNNWRLPGRAGGEAYELNELPGIRLIHSWLNPPEEEDLTAFIAAALQMEAAGRHVIDCLRRAYDAIERDQAQELSYQLVVCRDAVRALLEAFNGGIRKDRMRIPNFMTLVQPTMLWLLDHGEGPLEGASGPQACTLQLLDNFLGVPRDSALGGMILASRRYMLPGHRAVIEASDACSGVLRDYVARVADSRLTDLYNAVVGTLLTWRHSHQKRGAMYLKGDEKQPPAAYASTGLVVSAESDRVATFERAMRGHIEATEARELTDPWAGRERTLEALFRHLTEEQRTRLRGAAELSAAPAGALLLELGQRRPGLHFLEKGRARVLRSHGLQRVVIGTIGPGELFGEMSLLENEPASAEVRAQEACVVGRLDAGRIYELMRDDPSFGAGFYLGLAKLLSARLRRVGQILPELLDAEALGMRPLRVRPETADRGAGGVPAWERFCRDNAFHRDFWPLWARHGVGLSVSSQPPVDSSLADLLTFAAPGAGQPPGPALHLGAGPLALGLDAKAGVLLIDPSRTVAEAYAGLSGVATVRHENVRRLAQGFGFVETRELARAALDLLASFYSDAALVDILDWIYLRLAPGGELAGLVFASAAPNCPLIRAHGIPVGTPRTEDQLNDLFTRSRFRTSPVEFARSGAGRFLRFTVRKGL